MNSKDKILDRSHWDKNRGMTPERFAEAMDDPQEMDKLYVQHPGYHKNGTPREDPYGSHLKPAGTPTWDRPPATPQEEAIYYGVHIHNESNPLGLHSHVPGGELSGGHNHGPQNPCGQHHHKRQAGEMADLDGDHKHGGVNYPDGKHDHHPDNFG